MRGQADIQARRLKLKAHAGCRTDAEKRSVK